MKKIPPKIQKFLLAVYFVLGGTFTFELTVEHVQENDYLYAIVTVLAIVFDILFFKTLFSLFGKRTVSKVLSSVSRAFSVIIKSIGKLIDRVSGGALSKNKVFLDGKNERNFVFEIHSAKEGQMARKLPKLSKNADERQKARYAYAAHVFKKDKNVPSVLTPNEVERYLEENGENRELFERYNLARYTEEPLP